MAQANALIGVEKAAYYPTLSLTGSGGLAVVGHQYVVLGAGAVLVAGRVGFGDDLRCGLAQGHGRAIHREL